MGVFGLCTEVNSDSLLTDEWTYHAGTGQGNSNRQNQIHPWHPFPKRKIAVHLRIVWIYSVILQPTHMRRTLVPSRTLDLRKAHA